MAHIMVDSDFNEGPRQCRHRGRNNHITEKCWEKFSRPEWVVDLTLLSLVILLMLLQPLILFLPLWYFHRLSMIGRASSSSQNNHSTIHASSSGMNAYIASSFNFGY